MIVYKEYLYLSFQAERIVFFPIHTYMYFSDTIFSGFNQVTCSEIKMLFLLMTLRRVWRRLPLGFSF